MRKPTFASLLAGVLLLALVAPVSADSWARPFSGSAAGAVSFVPVSLETCPAGTYYGGLRSDSAATGTASHLGLVTMTSRHCTPATDWIAGDGAFLAADGDEVYFTYAGVAPLPTPTMTILVADVEFTITGGTGRFEHAQGGGSMTAYVTVGAMGAPAWDARWVWDGTIGY